MTGAVRTVAWRGIDTGPALVGYAGLPADSAQRGDRGGPLQVGRRLRGGRVCVGGFALPHTATAAAFLVSGLVLGVVHVGVARGRLTRLWRDECDGRVYTRGTAVTIGLFLALVAVKCALGALAYVLHLDDGSGLGEVMVMIALMVGVQSQIVWTRARALGARATDMVPAAV